MKTAEELFKEEFDNTECFIDYDKTGLEVIKTAMIKFAKLSIIEELKKHIEHPMKPGYRRHDILNKIKQLEK